MRPLDWLRLPAREALERPLFEAFFHAALQAGHPLVDEPGGEGVERWLRPAPGGFTRRDELTLRFAWRRPLATAPLDPLRLGHEVHGLLRAQEEGEHPTLAIRYRPHSHGCEIGVRSLDRRGWLTALDEARALLEQEAFYDLNPIEVREPSAHLILPSSFRWLATVRR
jgi:hypothetical protein